MAATFSGGTAAELPELERWDTRTGKTRVRRWKGTPTEIEFIKTQARLFSYNYSTSEDGPYLVVSVDYPEDEASETKPLSDEWWIEKNILTKDIWLLPSVQTALKTIGTVGSNIKVNGVPITTEEQALTTMAFYKKDFESFVKGNINGKNADGSTYTITLEGLLETAAFAGGAETRAVFKDLFEDMAKGTTSFQIIQKVLMRDTITNKKSTVKASKTNVGKIFTVQRLILDEKIPEDTKFDMPETGYFLKIEPSVKPIEKGKWKINQQFWYAEQYSKLIYGEALA